MTEEEFYSNYSKIMALKACDYFAQIPILRSYTDEVNFLRSDTISKIKERINSKSKILELGAGNNNFHGLLNSLGINCIYKSMDIDKNYFHDYHSIDEISETSSHVILFNLLEHLPFETGLEYLSKAQELLESDGTLMISVPNIWHPNHMMRCDITHIKAYPYQDLYALLSFMGFKEIEMYRIYHRPYRYTFKQFLISKLKIFFSLILEFDYTKDFWIFARKV